MCMLYEQMLDILVVKQRMSTICRPGRAEIGLHIARNVVQVGFRFRY